MDDSIYKEIKAVFDDSNNGNIHFGDVVRRLMSINVESYHVDYRCARTTYFLKNGQTLDLNLEPCKGTIPKEFDIDAIRAAIRAAQSGIVQYPEFKEITQNAGCCGYTVWICGKHVSYFGHCGETHVEYFPD